MKRILAHAGLAILFCLVFVSCRPHEERVMDRLDNLSEKIQKQGAKWNADQWLDALEELEDIHYDMEDCEFTPEQFRALGRVEGRLTVIIMTEGAKKLGDGLVSFMDGAGAFMKGYKEGASSMQGYSEGEFEKLESNLTDELDRIQTIYEEDN